MNLTSPHTAFIDGTPFSFEPGETLLDFIRRHLGHDHVPTLCDAPRLKPYGACRLCSVEIASSQDGPRKVVASCHTPVAAGARVFTASPKILRLRRHLIELVLTDHPLDCLTCEVNGNCELQAVAARVGISDVRYPTGENHLGRGRDVSHVFMTSDLAKCINCARCVRACDEVEGRFVLAMHGRGFDARIIKGLDVPFADSPCVACGACVQACPTSAISDVFHSKSLRATRKTRTVCGYCGVGCNLIVASRGGEVLSIEPATDSAVNPSHACVKGRYAFGFLHHPDRLRTPLVRRRGMLEAAGWDEALDQLVKNLRRIRSEHGPRVIGALSSARCTNEENYLMQKFIRAVIGCDNIDGCARLCHTPSAWGMREAFGTGAATNSFDDIEAATCLMVVGANPTEAHPVVGARILQRALKGVPLIVIDPRRTELAARAKFHLQCHPGTNAALLNLMARFILDAGLADTSFITRRCEGWAELETALRMLPVAEMAAVAGVRADLVRAAAIEYASADAAMCLHGLGVTEHEQGSKTVMLLCNLAMMTGNIGRPGTGVNPLRGQNNVQGDADMGCQPRYGPGYLDITDPAARELLEKAYGVKLDARPGLNMIEMLDAALAGNLKALWVAGEDLVQSNPDSTRVIRALENLELLVVQDLFLTETARLAHVVLPAASFLEKDGTFTSSERRVQRVRAVVPPPAGARPDWWILCEVMRRFGCPQDDATPQGVFAEIASVASILTGATWDSLGDSGLQWPVRAHGEGTPVLHTDSFKRGRAKFHFFPWMEPQELTAHRAAFPLVLTTGRMLEHYNSGTMTRRSGTALLAAADTLWIHPDDATPRGITSGKPVRVTSARGEAVLTATVTGDMRPGELFTTFHFPEIMVNRLTGPGHDAETLCPEYKVVAVQVAEAAVTTAGKSTDI